MAAKLMDMIDEIGAIPHLRSAPARQLNIGPVDDAAGAGRHHVDAVGEIGRLSPVLRVIPRRIRDGIYDFIARNRYGWFGRRDQCMIPTDDIRSRFLD